MLKEPSKVEQRYDAVVAVVRDGMKVSEVAEKFGVHRDTVYVWLSRYEADGLDGLADRSHRPRHSPLQMAAMTEARVLELRRLHPHWGPMSIRHRLGRDGVEPLPSVSGIYRALLRARADRRPRPDAGNSRPTSGGSGAGRWSCGRWTWWVGCCWPTGPSARC